MTVNELPGWLALTCLALFTLGGLFFTLAGATLLTRTLRRLRPPAVDWDDLDRTCCLRSWESRGTQHDPTHCTRKDTTR
ncbi:hypothetical protein [Streptomyces sp. C1-2]|uniref:hypothetical protein n=1 Tax=Streptomyces sp. C1-2 TaxID=2720022 RepID=UPI001432736E|nr:hypothetical protein [Streptomyces sp. C1-2]NJP70397.1 hypothetical protein [Streptomyces sp. C1-2]